MRLASLRERPCRSFGPCGVCQAAPSVNEWRGIRPHLRGRDRYGQGKRCPPIEVFRLERQLHSILREESCVMLADEEFFLVWSWR